MVLIRNLHHRQFRVQLTRFLRKYRFSELRLGKLRKNLQCSEAVGKVGNPMVAVVKKWSLDRVVLNY